MICLGLDPGRDGAAVVLDGTRCVAQTRTSDLIGASKWHAAHVGVTDWLRSVHAEHCIDLAVLELYAGRPGEGRGSGLTTGVGWGLWLGAISALRIHVVIPASSKWTRALFSDVPGEGKERSIVVASRRVVDLDLRPGRCRKAHSGLADAACLALYGLTKVQA